MRVLLLVNATASSVTARKRVAIRKTLADRHDVELAETSRRGHATRLARAAANDGFDVVAVFAGDGTLNETADGLAGTPTALAPLPGGSTNVYARTLGYPNDAIDATRVLLRALDDRSSFTRVGLGRANGRRFLFNAGLGFDAAVIRRVERYGELKRYASHPLHVLAAFETWFRHYDRSKPRFDIELAGGERIEGVYFAIVSKTSPYTFLGPISLRLADAGIHTPLALTAFQKLDAVSLLGGAASAMRSGRYLHRHRGIAHRNGITALTVEGRGAFPWQADGDDLGDVEHLDIAYEPDTLTVVVPPAGEPAAGAG